MNSVENKNGNNSRYKNKYKYNKKRYQSHKENPNKKSQKINVDGKIQKSNNPDILKKANKNRKTQSSNVNNTTKKTYNVNKSQKNNYSDKFQKINNIKKFRRVREKSCGCIIINNGKVLLIQQKKGNWGFPKGHVEFNETETQTAIREVKEETNLDVKIYNKRRYTEKYFTYKGRVKQVVYFLAKQTGGFEKRQESEIRAMKWLEFDEAIEMITYPNTKDLFGKVLRDLK